MIFIRFYITVFLTLIAITADAKQTYFVLDTKDNGTHFKYQFHDHQQTLQQFSFYLSHQALFDKFRDFKNFQPNAVKKEYQAQVLKKLSTIDRRNLPIRWNQRTQDFELPKRLSDIEKQQHLRTLNSIRQEIYQELLQQHYYTLFTTPYGKKGVKPDHLFFARQSIDDIQPLIDGFADRFPTTNYRKTISFFLSFIQSIPYSTLESRLNTNGTGFSPPLRLLYNNLGDCDSKTVLLATILKALYPKMNIILVYLPQHALIGFEIPYLKADTTVEIDGHHYVLAEPTGPAAIPFAQIASSSQHFIQSKQFSTEQL